MEASDVGQTGVRHRLDCLLTQVWGHHTPLSFWMLCFPLCKDLFSLLRMVLMIIKLACARKWQIWDLNPGTLSLALYS